MAQPTHRSRASNQSSGSAFRAVRAGMPALSHIRCISWTWRAMPMMSCGP